MRNRFKTLLSLPLRAWRSRGFGVHSPFAYSFITGVIRCSYGYYAYSEIGDNPYARRLYRIILALAPEKVVVTGPLPDPFSVAVNIGKAETEKTPCTSRTSRLAIVPPDAIVGISYLRTIIESGGAVVFNDIRDSATAEIFSRTAKYGMTFAGVRQAVIVGGSLPHQQFPVLM